MAQLPKKVKDAIFEIANFANDYAEDVYGEEHEYEGADENREGVYKSAEIALAFINKK